MLFILLQTRTHSVLGWILTGIRILLPSQGQVLKGSLTTGRAVKAPAGSPGKYGGIVVVVKEDKEALIAGEVLGGEKWHVERYKRCFRIKSPGDPSELNTCYLQEVSWLLGSLLLHFLLLYPSIPLFMPCNLSKRTSPVQWNPQGQIKPLKPQESNQRFLSPSRFLCCSVWTLFIALMLRVLLLFLHILNLPH